MMLAMRPGSAFLELFPPRAQPVTSIYLALAQRLRLRYAAQTVFEARCDPSVHFHMQPTFTADPAAVAAHAAQLLAADVEGGAARRRDRGALRALFSRFVPLAERVSAVETAVEAASGGNAGGGSGVPGSVVLLMTSTGPRRLAGLSLEAGALVMPVAVDFRPHLNPQYDVVRGSGVVGDAASAIGERRLVMLDASRSPPNATAAAVAGADLVVASHGTGTVGFLPALRPGAAWIDLVPPRTPGRYVEYAPLAEAAGVALYTLMLREADCNATESWEQAELNVDGVALAAMAARALRTDW
jgi:hypothetical protein